MASASTFLQIANRASDQLNGAINNSVTTIVVDSTTLFPASFPYHITVDAEIMAVTAKTSTQFTVTRAQQGTAAASHSDNIAVQLRVTAKSLSDLNTAVANIETGTKTLDHVKVDGSEPQIHAERVALTGDKADLRATSWNAFGGLTFYRKSATDTRKKFSLGTEDATGQDPDLVVYRWTGAGGGEASTEAWRVLNAGGVRLPNNVFFYGRNAANSGNISGWKINASDVLEAGAVVDLGTLNIQNTTKISGIASATSLIVGGHVTGGAPGQRDVVIQTGNASNPQTLVTRMSFASNAAAGNSSISALEEFWMYKNFWLEDSVADPVSLGYVTRNGNDLKYHNGTGVMRLNLADIFTTKGDIFVATATRTPARQAIGSDGQVLTADSAQTNGLKWATPSGNGVTIRLKNRIGALNTTLVSVTDLNFDVVSGTFYAVELFYYVTGGTVAGIRTDFATSAGAILGFNTIVATYGTTSRFDGAQDVTTDLQITTLADPASVTIKAIIQCNSNATITPRFALQSGTTNVELEAGWVKAVPLT